VVFSAGCSCRTSVDSSATSGCYSATSHAAAAAVVSSEKSFLDTGSCSSPDDVDILSCDYPDRQVVHACFVLVVDHGDEVLQPV